eukprot:gene8591-8773_t
MNEPRDMDLLVEPAVKSQGSTAGRGSADGGSGEIAALRRQLQVAEASVTEAHAAAAAAAEAERIALQDDLAAVKAVAARQKESMLAQLAAADKALAAAGAEKQQLEQQLAAAVGQVSARSQAAADAQEQASRDVALLRQLKAAELQERLTTSELRDSESRRQLQVVLSELESARSRAAEFESAASELAGLGRALAEAERQMTGAGAELSELSRQLAEAKGQRDANQAEVSRLMAEVSDLKSSSGDRAALAADLAALRASHEATVARLAGLEGADERAAQLTAELDRVRERLDKSEGQVTRLEQRILAKEAEHEATAAALEEARAERETVRLASAAQMDNLAALTRQRWPRAVQLLVEEAEAAKEAEVQEKLAAEIEALESQNTVELSAVRLGVEHWGWLCKVAGQNMLTVLLPGYQHIKRLGQAVPTINSGGGSSNNLRAHTTAAVNVPGRANASSAGWASSGHGHPAGSQSPYVASLAGDGGLASPAFSGKLSGQLLARRDGSGSMTAQLGGLGPSGAATPSGHHSRSSSSHALPGGSYVSKHPVQALQGALAAAAATRGNRAAGTAGRGAAVSAAAGEGAGNGGGSLPLSTVRLSCDEVVGLAEAGGTPRTPAGGALAASSGGGDGWEVESLKGLPSYEDLQGLVDEQVEPDAAKQKLQQMVQHVMDWQLKCEDRERRLHVMQEEVERLEGLSQITDRDALYLRSVIVSGFESGELPSSGSMFLVLARLLHFSEQEVQRIQQHASKPAGGISSLVLGAMAGGPAVGGGGGRR